MSVFARQPATTRIATLSSATVFIIGVLLGFGTVSSFGLSLPDAGMSSNLSFRFGDIVSNNLGVVAILVAGLPVGGLPTIATLLLNGAAVGILLAQTELTVVLTTVLPHAVFE